MDAMVDLELWTAPRASAVVLDGKRVASVCRAATGLDADVVLGLNWVPDGTDVENVRVGLELGEFSREEFLSFCRSYSLVADAGNVESAARFIAFSWGQALAWLHFPADERGLPMARKLFAWAIASGYLVSKGQNEPPLSIAEIAGMWGADA